MSHSVAGSGATSPQPSNRGFDAEVLKSFGTWSIRPDILYLDNGAFGSCPLEISKKQQEIRQEIEENPHDFFERNFLPSWNRSREALSKFINADTLGLVVLPGATHGMNVVIQALKFKAGDEILTTNHAYSSVRLMLEQVAKRDDACIVVVNIPWMVASEQILLQNLLSHVTERTRLAVIDHIPSRSGLVFPIKQIVSEFESRNIDTLVDGAHVPGMLPLDVKDINAAYYVANCHKWMCTPRGVGFLHIREDKVQNIKPLIIARSPHVSKKSSHSTLEHGFTWFGTSDPSAVLCLPSSIEFLKKVVPGGHDGLVKRNHKLAILARRIVCRALGIPIPCPDNVIGSMATIPLPDSPGPEQEGMLSIQQMLWEKHKIVIPVYSYPSYPKRVIRLSVQAYNHLDQYLRLADCLRAVLYHEASHVPRSLSFGGAKGLKWPWPQRVWKFQGPPPCGGCTHELRLESASDNQDHRLEVPYQDVTQPSIQYLMRLAKERVRNIATEQFFQYPVALYPTSSKAQAVFTINNGPQIRHANTEIAKMNYMLGCVKERCAPQIMASYIQTLLEGQQVLEQWPDTARVLKNQAQTIVRTITCAMASARTPTVFPNDSKAFVYKVVPYETEAGRGNVGEQLWLLALSDLTQNSYFWSPAGVEAFLQIHSFLKDPIGGLRKDVKLQALIFLDLLNEMRVELESMELPPQTWEEILTQLALESSFLSHFRDQPAAYVHFQDDQQLVYSYVDIDDLGHAEFACPHIVIRMLQELVALGTDNEHSIPPVTIAYGYPICSSHGKRAIVVDGYNRVATILFMRLLSLYRNGDTEEMDESLREYCRNFGLSPICFVNLHRVLETLEKSHSGMLKQLKNWHDLSWFQNVRQIPALITEEASFLTELVTTEGRQYLQPVQQSVFASDDMLVALPSKMQTHGRAKGFKALPIR